MQDPIVGRPVEERIAHIEGTLEQMDKRLTSVERRLDAMDTKFEAKFNWMIGLLLTSWITIVGLLVAVLLKVT